MRKTLLPLLILSLSGCNLAPHYDPPTPAIAEHYNGAVVSSGQSVAAIRWQDYFVDPELRRLLSTALNNNQDLAQSYARLAQMRAQYQIADSQRLPTIGASGGASRTRQPDSSAGSNPSSGQEIDQFTTGIGISAFELDFWGRARNLSEAERLRYFASAEGVRSFQLSLIGQVASTYFEIRAGEERAAIAFRTLEGRIEGQRIAKKRLQAGVTSTIDYDQSELLLTQAEAELADVRRTTEQARNLLDVLTGVPSAMPAETQVPLDSQLLAIEPGLPSALLANRPDILQAEHNLHSASADIGAARAAFFPSISLTGQSGFASTDLDSLFNQGSRTWSYGVAIDLPIFDWSQRRSRLQATEARREELLAAYQMSVQTAFREVSDALVAKRRYAEQLDALSRSLDAQSRLARTARLRYERGLSIYLEVLDAERNRFVVEQNLIRLRTADLQNAVNLFVALGGGSGSIAPLPP